ncbi:porin [Aromatoleum aromaticum]|uniref:Outer membrane protein (Porin) n=1 Tax=Aromatoleum aromaticum (strain DSM 19018 / LMG 30748 / EbN1) TaxID=76114 RepID=Q5P0J7_AROAE|nr:porin [Aromatoleum aromaticum]NMG55744.1 porin [Aromatoleum aromaticum]CAI09167.1 Outer membrane protein (porin) [Aromatoleum aromaticum EbN1]
MHKKRLAIAVSCIVAGLVSASAAAQSNVTVYGVADAFIGYGKTGDAKFTGVQSGGWAGSRLGFRGTEDLGNGLKAVFTLEYGIELDQNAGLGAAPNLSRQQFIGLQGGFGFIGLGRQYHPGYYVFKYDAIVPVPISPQFALAAAAGSNLVAGGPARVSNSINYKSPNFGGLTLNAIYGLNEVNQDDDRRKGDIAAIGADYANGPLAIGLIYSQVKEHVGDEDKREAYIGGSYDFGVFKLAGSYQRIEDATAAEDTDNVWHIGGTVPIGTSGKFSVAYGRLDADTNDSDADSWAVVYSHSLSKRTLAYAGYGHISNDDGRAVRSPSFVSAANTSPGDTSRNLMVGLNHLF